jgi:hypothetical protein
MMPDGDGGQSAHYNCSSHKQPTATVRKLVYAWVTASGSVSRYLRASLTSLLLILQQHTNTQVIP